MCGKNVVIALNLLALDSLDNLNDRDSVTNPHSSTAQIGKKKSAFTALLHSSQDSVLRNATAPLVPTSFAALRRSLSEVTTFSRMDRTWGADSFLRIDV